MNMRAVVRNGEGRTFVESHPAPRTPKANSDEVIVRVHAAAINPVDYKAPKAILGAIVGLDFAGVVEAVGEGHTGTLKVGVEVYGAARGSLADLVLANAKSLALKPKTATFLEAASMPTTYLTGLQGLRDHGKLPTGGRVLVIGASGGCGLAGLQLARSMGASLIVGVCSSKNAEFVKQHGAHRVVEYNSERIETYFGKQVANEERFDVVYDCATNSGGGEDYKAQALNCLKQPTGQYVAINGAVGMWLRFLTGWGQKKNEHLFLANANTGDLAYLASLMDAVGTGDGTPAAQVKPVICRVLPFSASGVHEGFELLKSRRAVGKVVFDIAASREGAAGISEGT
jgi:NADPH:quinone reductase-like Zn-dependent oxidoreductase